MAKTIAMDALHPGILAAIHRAIGEDVGTGDVTTDHIVRENASMTGTIVARQAGVVAGLDVARRVYYEFEAAVSFQPAAKEGARVEPQGTLAVVSGPARALLTAERTALNFLGRMSGIATLTRQYVDAVAGTKAVILDTRKTAPGLRMVDKLAVVRGGGKNHRFGLYDMLLVKDNHIDFAGGIRQAIEGGRRASPDLELEVETRTLEHVQITLDMQVKRILLDNMSVDMIAAAVAMARGRALLEASGNVSLENVRRIAETGVDFISVGALTHSAPTFDLSFEYVNPA